MSYHASGLVTTMANPGPQPDSDSKGRRRKRHSRVQNFSSHKFTVLISFNVSMELLLQTNITLRKHSLMRLNGLRCGSDLHVDEII